MFPCWPTKTSVFFPLGGCPLKKPSLLSRSPAEDSELSFDADGLRSAVVRWCKEAEQAVRLIAYTGGEVQPVTGSRCLVVCKAPCPQAGALARISVSRAEEASRSPPLTPRIT